MSLENIFRNFLRFVKQKLAVIQVKVNAGILKRPKKYKGKSIEFIITKSKEEYFRKKFIK